MHLILKDFNEINDWEECRTYLEASPAHFLKSEHYPPEDLDPILKKQVIIMGMGGGDGYYHLPKSTSNATLKKVCMHIWDEDGEAPMEFGLPQFFQTFADRILGKFEMEEVAREILVHASNLFEADGSAILLINKEHTALTFAAIHSRNEGVAQKLPGMEVPMGTGIAGWVAEHRKPVILTNAREDARFSDIVDSKTDYETTDLMAAPIILGSELVGVLEVVNRDQRSFSDWDFPALSVVATVIALFAEKARLESERDHFEKAAGKADIANSVLHNIGNVLNSVNVSASLMETKLEKSKITQFLMANQLLEEHMENLADFFTNHPKGKILPQFFLRLGDELAKEGKLLSAEVRKVASMTNTMRDIIETQQMLAKMGSSETQDLIQVIEEALGTQQDAINRMGVVVTRNFQTGRPIRAQRAKLIHVFINIIKNGIEAMVDLSREERILILETGESEEGAIFCRIIDQGIGMGPDIMDRIFSHGFTTKKDGHGFGLASCAKAMEEMKGRIEVESEGPGMGSCFSLYFPSVPQTI